MNISLSPGLRDVLGEMSTHEWAREQAQNLLNLAKEGTLPINPKSLFYLRNINPKISYRKNLGGRGLLQPIKNGFEITLNDYLQYKSKRNLWRFTLAHEIGHSFFFDIKASPPNRLFGLESADKSEELLCDLIAAEILIPRNHLTDMLGNTISPTSKTGFLEIIKEYSKIFQVSIGAMGMRLINGLEIWNGVLITSKWLPKFNPKVNFEHASAKDNTDKAWRIAWSIIPYKFDRNLFIPKPTNYRKGLPKLRWTLLNDLIPKIELNKINSIKIKKSDLPRVGNLKKIIEESWNTDECVLDLLVTKSEKSGENLYKNNMTSSRNTDNYSDITVMIAINLDPK